MKTTIEVYNETTGLEIWTLNELREVNCTRRKRILTGEGLSQKAQKTITVHTKDTTKYQQCCHYSSFQLRQMNAKKSIEIFNHDGSQKARLIIN